MEKVLGSFILTFNEEEWDFADENELGSQLAIFGKDIYVEYQKDFDFKMSTINNLTDIRSSLDDLMDGKISRTKIMFSLIFLSLAINRDISKKE
jgi:hypothetical protein